MIKAMLSNVAIATLQESRWILVRVKAASRWLLLWDEIEDSEDDTAWEVHYEEIYMGESESA